MNPRHLSSSSTPPLHVGGIVPWSRWGLVVVALLGLSGCLPTDRGWVQEQLAVVQMQMAVVRDRVTVVEQQFGRLDPKVDRILAQTEQLVSREIDPAEPLPEPDSRKPAGRVRPRFNHHRGGNTSRRRDNTSRRADCGNAC